MPRIKTLSERIAANEVAEVSSENIDDALISASAPHPTLPNQWIPAYIKPSDITATIEQSIEDLQNQVDHTEMEITSFTNDVIAAEIGSTVEEINFTWALNKSADTLSINQGIGAVTGTTHEETGLDITEDITFTLTADDGTEYTGNTDTASTSIAFCYRVYYGTSAATSLNSAAVIALSNQPLSTSKNRTVTIDGNGQYIYFAYPADWGAATFAVNGLSNNAWTLEVVSVTNASGHTENYNVYRSDDIQNGTGLSITLS